MKNAKELSARIHAASAELDRLSGELERCNAAIAAADEHTATLEQLRQQRADEAAQAFIESRPANTAALDKEIIATEKAGSRAQEQGDAARGALEFINRRRGELDAELKSAREELTAVAIEDVAGRRAKAAEAYRRAVDALRGPLEEMSALDGITRVLTGNYRPHTPSGMLLDALKSEGLRVWGERGLQGPDWFGAIGQGSNERCKALADEFRAAGLKV